MMFERCRCLDIIIRTINGDIKLLVDEDDTVRDIIHRVKKEHKDRIPEKFHLKSSLRTTNSVKFTKEHKMKQLMGHNLVEENGSHVIHIESDKPKSRDKCTIL